MSNVTSYFVIGGKLVKICFIFDYFSLETSIPSIEYHILFHLWQLALNVLVLILWHVGKGSYMDDVSA